MPPKKQAELARVGQQMSILEEAPPYVYKSKISKHLSCPICMEILLAPVRLSCSHVFCNNCIGRVGSTLTFKCPMDRTIIDSKAAHFDLVAEKMLNAQTVYCKHRSNGCMWEGPRGEWTSHSSVCELKEIPDFLKKLKLIGPPKENSNGFNMFEDEELQEEIEKEAPEIDLPTRVYLRNKPVVEQLMKENSMSMTISQASQSASVAAPKQAPKAPKKRGLKASGEKQKQLAEENVTKEQPLQTSSSADNLAFLAAFGENGELQIDVEEFMNNMKF